MLIENVGQLLDHGYVPARRRVLDILSHALREADPYRFVADRIERSPGAVRLGSAVFYLEQIDRLYVIGGGKASQRVAKAIEDRLGELVTGGVVAVKEGERHDLSRIEAVDAAHPVPDHRSVGAARRVMRIAEEASQRDLVITAISGGSSSLLCLPPEGVGLDEKRALYRALLGCGAPIEQVNAVRKHVSAIKGGRLAAAALPAHVVNFAVSDVVGDPLDCFAGPVVPDPTTVEDAVAILKTYDLWETVPRSVRDHLLSGTAESPKSLDEERVHTALSLSVSTAGRASARRAKELGLRVEVITHELEGESRDVGRHLGAMLRGWADGGDRMVALIASGEMTVTMPEGGGTGGPNQEAGLCAAMQLDGQTGAALAFLGTDGTDGPTTVAGSIVDGSTAERARTVGMDLAGAIDRHDATPALVRLGDAIVTGPTGTNLADLVVGVAMPRGMTGQGS